MARNSGSSLIYLLGLASLVSLAAVYFRQLKTKMSPTKKNSINKNASDLYFLLIEKGFNYQQARYITAQAGFETAGFTSKIYKQNNNCFGMKLALVRQTTALGERYGHAYYESVASCVEDFKIYYKNFKYLSIYSSLKAYIEAIKKNGYFTSELTEYINGSARYLNEYFSQ
jgi:uncharacterized FlgJ-related protein